MTQVAIRRIRKNAALPKYMSDGASGCDVTACLDRAIEIAPGARLSVPTGLSVEIPDGFEIQVRPRSGLSFKRGLTVINAPGTVDSDYRGEICILLVNLGDEAVEIAPGDRIAQLVLQRVERISWNETSELSDTTRGEGGFGSTGVI